MIPRFSTTWQTPQWQTELAQAIRSPEQLLEMLELPRSLLAGAREADGQFPLRVPLSFVRRMLKGDITDPLLQQVLPVGRELDTIQGFGADPVGDMQAQTLPGLLHKYHGRALLVTTGACAVHCRYCFRREFPYQDNHIGHENLQQVLDYLEKQSELHEIILSGGDPLSLSDKRLIALIDNIEQLPQIKTLRIHSRLPVVIPSRLSQQLLSRLSQGRLQKVMVLHVNHAQEFDSELKQSLLRLKSTGIQLLNQTVLLKGVNDTVECLEELSHALWECGILPYYLHMLDRARGTAHFEVDQTQAQELIKKLRIRLPGYLLPELVRENAGEPHKSPL